MDLRAVAGPPPGSYLGSSAPQSLCPARPARHRSPPRHQPGPSQRLAPRHHLEGRRVPEPSHGGVRVRSSVPPGLRPQGALTPSPMPSRPPPGVWDTSQHSHTGGKLRNGGDGDVSRLSGLPGAAEGVPARCPPLALSGVAAVPWSLSLGGSERAPAPERQSEKRQRYSKARSLPQLWGSMTAPPHPA